jgi:hypothetical protein
MSNKILLFFGGFATLIIIFSIIYYFFRPVPPPIPPFMSMDVCGFMYQWQSVKEGYDSKTSLELATKLESLAKLQADSLNKGNIKMSVDVALKDIIQASTSREVNVPIELYENTQRYCLQIETIANIIKSGILGNDTALINKARRELLEISLNFGKIKTQIQSNSTTSSSKKVKQEETVKIDVALNQESADAKIYFNDVECTVIKDDVLLKTIEVPKNVKGTLTVRKNGKIICGGGSSLIQFSSYQSITPCQ